MRRELRMLLEIQQRLDTLERLIMTLQKMVANHERQMQAILKHCMEELVDIEPDEPGPGDGPIGQG